VPPPTLEADHPGGEPSEPLSHLSGLITRVLESADQLAASTRRTRSGDKGDKVASADPGTTDHRTG
jgi:hypothetical protein